MLNIARSLLVIVSFAVVLSFFYLNLPSLQSPTHSFERSEVFFYNFICIFNCFFRPCFIFTLSLSLGFVSAIYKKLLKANLFGGGGGGMGPTKPFHPITLVKN